MLSMLHESCQVNLFNKLVMLKLRNFDLIINKLGFVCARACWGDER